MSSLLFVHMYVSEHVLTSIVKINIIVFCYWVYKQLSIYLSV